MKVQTLAEQLLFSTLRIQTEHSLGTGFIVNHEWAENRQGRFLVTNKHVIQGSSYGHLTFTISDRETEDYRPSIGRIFPITLSERAWEWEGHPSEDVEVTVLPLSGLFDHVGKNGRRPYYRSIQTSIIPSQDALEELDAVEEVLFVGYPNGLYDSVNNLPITRRGSTASPLSIDYEGKPVFLIDASVFQGSSGSPVLIYDNGSWLSRDGGLISGQRLFLLGLLGSVFYRETDGTLTFEEIPAAVKPVVKTSQMIDLGIVHKSRTILENIEHLLRRHGEL